MIKELIIIEKLNIPSYFLGIISECVRLSSAFKCIIYTDNTDNYSYLSSEQIQVLPYIQFAEDKKKWSKNEEKIFLTDIHGSRFYSEDFNGINCIKLFLCYAHSADSFSVRPNTITLVSSKFALDEILRRNPNHKKITAYHYFLPGINSEIFYAGFYHYYAVYPYLNMSVSERKKALEMKLGIRLDSHLPLLSYPTSEYSREGDAARTLNKLVPFTNIIVKELARYRTPNLSEKIIKCDSSREPLLFMSSDMNLISMFSGGIISNIIMGNRMIPYYTSYTGFHYGIITEQYHREYRYNLCESFYERLKKINDFLEDFYDIIPPINILNEKKIINLIGNETFWKNYDKKIQILRKKMMGELEIEQSQNHTSKFVLSVCERN